MKPTIGARRRYRFALRLFGAIGIPSATAAVLLAGCGGIAVVDGAGGGGGEGSTTTSTTTTTTTTGGGFQCDGVELPPFGQLVYGCFPPQGNACPEDYQVWDDFAEIYSKECTDPEVCPCYGASCGCITGPVDIPCGPELIAGECCYYAVIAPSEGFCEGRPFTVDGHGRRAGVCSREGWLAAPRTAAPTTMTPALAQQLAEGWLDDARNEHASVASFARFVLELLAVGAPASIVADAQQAIADEIRHAQLCFGLASRYAGTPMGPDALALEGSLDSRRTLTEIAAATVAEGCVNETLAGLCAQAACDAASDPQARTALEEIAEDEARHAALAWQFVAWACRQGDAAERAGRRVALTKAFDEAIAAARRNCVADPAPQIGWDARAQQLANHGQLVASEQRAIMRAGLRDVVEPCMRGLLESAEASQSVGPRQTETPPRHVVS